MNNKYVNYISPQQYTLDPTNQQKKKKKSSHKPILGNTSHSTKFGYYFIQYIFIGC